MRARTLLLGSATAGLLAAGVWIGRATSAPAAGGASTSNPAAPRTAAIAARPAVRPASTRPPALQPRRAPTVPGLAADLVDRDPKVRRAAVRELARDPDADPGALVAAARDGDLEVGVTAAIALGRRHAEGGVPVAELIAIASDRALDDRVRVSALNGLGLVASPEAGGLLAELVARGSTLERSSAAILLAHQDPELAVPALIRALGDADAQVRANAHEALRARSRGRDFGTDAAAWGAWWSARPR